MYIYIYNVIIKQYFVDEIHSRFSYDEINQNFNIGDKLNAIENDLQTLAGLKFTEDDKKAITVAIDGLKVDYYTENIKELNNYFKKSRELEINKYSLSKTESPSKKKILNTKISEIEKRMKAIEEGIPKFNDVKAALDAAKSVNLIKDKMDAEEKINIIKEVLNEQLDKQSNLKSCIDKLLGDYKEFRKWVEEVRNLHENEKKEGNTKIYNFVQLLYDMDNYVIDCNRKLDMNKSCDEGDDFDIQVFIVFYNVIENQR